MCSKSPKRESPMSLTKRSPLFLCLAVCLLNASFAVGSRSQSQAAPITIPANLKPFTVYQREQSFPRERNQPPAMTDFTIAQSSNGSRVREYTISGRWSPNGREGTSVDIWNVPKGHYINVEPFTHSISTFVMSDSEISDFLRSAHACDGIRSILASDNLPSKTVLGHKVYQIVSREHDIEDSRWVAPDLNCFPLEKTEVFPSGAKNVTTVVKVDEGEPPDSIFTPPARYVERSPAQVESVYEKMFAGKELYPKQMVEHAESEYRKSR
jgi:hypothetical protein